MVPADLVVGRPQLPQAPHPLQPLQTSQAVAGDVQHPEPQVPEALEAPQLVAGHLELQQLGAGALEAPEAAEAVAVQVEQLQVKVEGRLREAPEAEAEETELGAPNKKAMLDKNNVE